MPDISASLEGRIAVVTGVSRQGQIDETVARALAEDGAALAICTRTQGNVEARPADLRQADARVLAVAASLIEESGAKAIDRGRDQGTRGSTSSLRPTGERAAGPLTASI